MTYSEKLKDPRWQKKRLEVLERDHWRCRECSSNQKQLHVHHRYYIKGREPWEYPDYCYISLCWECHKEKGHPEEGKFFGWELLIDALMCRTTLQGRCSAIERVSKEMQWMITACRPHDVGTAIGTVILQNKELLEEEIRHLLLVDSLPMEEEAEE